ncbi:hypothetical protein BC939DRAFT_443205 [Gamsiella multidivaricata]|uniref:uncharacterized protein n=1 Tax=Gamsiella multidivaricata TaxID=101098 RepID=UPI0022202E73|nr:uncharacterized protein BC939DRAFT_443205 [Gamsiella multidivaricata]KAG0368659.1 hypothetical protein BGZ54_001470 [Gamsiella multidivaricata]KAI7828537.1 hypothetical protein BC939DRAFT_443205 [Gamsiella multidivaricata]
MKSTFLASTIALVLGTVLVPSFTHADVADQCLVGLAGLLSNPSLTTCVPMAQLTLLVSGPITPKLVNDTAAAVCSYPVCSSTTITLVENTAAQNCVNTSDPTTADLVYGAATLYVPFREGVCQRVQTPNNGTFCITVLAESMTAYLAQHPSPLGLKIFSNATVLKQYVDSMPKDLLCTPCNKAMINPLNNYIAQNQSSLRPQVLNWAKVVQSEVQLKCGADFTNGAAPSTTSTDGKSAGILSAAAKYSVFTAMFGAIFSAGALLL